MKFVRKNNKNRGVVLLITVVVASIVLTIGIGILNVILKEMMLSSFNKNSRVAFFAADSGVECAMYWDFIKDVAIEKGVPLGYPDSFFPYDATTTDDFNHTLPNDGVWWSFGIAQARDLSFFDPFCQNQTATDVFVDNFSDSEVSWAIPSWNPGMSNSLLAHPDGDSSSTVAFLLYMNTPKDVNKPCALVQVSREISSDGSKTTQITSEGFDSCNGNNSRRSSRGVKVSY